MRRTAAEWRMLAADCRRAAVADDPDEGKRLLMILAYDFEQEAEQLDRLIRTEPLGGGRR